MLLVWAPTTQVTPLRDHVFSIFSYPLVIISDNGSSFANKLMKAAQQLYGFRHICVLPHTPQANGLAEQAVKRLKLMLDRHTADYQHWKPMLGMCMSAVNQRVNSGSTETPFTAQCSEFTGLRLVFGLFLIFFRVVWYWSVKVVF